MEKILGDIRRARPLLGTFVEIWACGAARDLEAAADAAFAAIAKTHALMSFHDGGSDVSRLNCEARLRPTEVDPWTFRVLEAALDMRRNSGGAFDVTVAHAPAGGSIELLDGRRVRFHGPEVMIDLGGVAKGFAVDRAIDVLRRWGVSAALVNAGGDLAAFGTLRQTVHVRDPRDPRRLFCEVEPRDEAFASSGGCFHPFESPEVSSPAIVDPETREPVRAVAGATVRAPSCMLADALTKAVMIQGTASAPLLERYNAGALMILADGDAHISPGWLREAQLAAE